MRRALPALALTLLLVVPAASARDPDPYPDLLADLLPELIAASEARGRPSENATWYPQAADYLQKAKGAAEEGRFRLVLFHLETYEEIVVTHRLNDSVASLGSDGERKARVATATQKYLEETEEKWTTFRERLHEFDGQVQSVHTAENALYAADIAISAIISTDDYAGFARELPKQPTLDIGYIQALVRTSYSPGLVIDFATRMLREIGGSGSEGLPPLADKVNLTGLLVEAMLVDYSGAGSPLVDQIDERVEPGRNNREGFLSLAGVFGVKRADRLSQMQTQFGDARARRDVVTDADRFMDKALNNTTVEKPRAFGLQGTFSADAVDRALYAHEIIANGKGDLSVVLVAWSSIDAAHYAEDIMAKFSPVKPSDTQARAPMPHAALLVVALLGLALLMGRRTSR